MSCTRSLRFLAALDLLDMAGIDTAFQFYCTNCKTEIIEDVKEECEKYGPVLDLKIPRPSGGRQNPGVGKIFVKYEQPESARRAQAALAGRKFADRTVVVTFFGEVRALDADAPTSLLTTNAGIFRY